MDNREAVTLTVRLSIPAGVPRSRAELGEKLEDVMFSPDEAMLTDLEPGSTGDDEWGDGSTVRWALHTDPSAGQSNREAIIAALQSNRTIVYENLDEVPVGSSGYFGPGGQDAYLTATTGWITPSGRKFTPPVGALFTAQQGPAVDEALVAKLEQLMFPGA